MRSVCTVKHARAIGAARQHRFAARQSPPAGPFTVRNTHWPEVALQSASPEHAMVLRVTYRGRVIAAACLEALRAASDDDSLRRRNDCDFRRPPQNHNVDVIGCPAGVRQGTSGPTYDGLGSAQFRAWRPGQRARARVFAKKESSLRRRSLSARGSSCVWAAQWGASL